MHKTIENMKPTIPFRTPMRALRAMAAAACLWAGACFPLPAQTHAVIPTADQVGAACMPDTLAPIRAPFDMPQLARPVFPDHTRMLTAQELEQHRLASVAIQQAIDETSRRGGGTVIVPSGVWNVGRIELKSRVNLHLSEGAELHFSGRVEDYLRYRGVDIYQSPAPIAKETAAYAVDDRRPDYSGKQQYR